MLRTFKPYFGIFLRKSSLTKKNDFLIKKTCVRNQLIRSLWTPLWIIKNEFPSFLVIVCPSGNWLSILDNFVRFFITMDSNSMLFFYQFCVDGIIDFSLK